MLSRLLDIIVALVGSLLLLLMLPLVALLIRLDSRGPIFFKCNRVGKNGEIFKMFKFRTMYETPTPLGASVSPQGDPRVTPVGKVLRRLKLNEFPQFLNILKGDMTLIGPRPEAPDLAPYYPPEAQEIFSVKPGLVGPNQILGRNEEEFYPTGVDARTYYLKELLPQKLPLDLQYIREKSFLLDLKYLFLGVWVTITGVIKKQHLTDNFSQIVMIIADILFCPFSFILAYLIRFETFLYFWTNPEFQTMILLTVFTRIPFLLYFGCYRTLVRYLGLQDLWRIVKGVTIGSILFVVVDYFIDGALLFGRSIYIIDWLCLTMLLIGYRLAGKFLRQYRERQGAEVLERRPVLIWGVGEEGRWCLRFLKEHQNPSYEIVGFMAEDPERHSQHLEGYKILGDHHHLEVLIQLYQIQEIFLAAPDISARTMERVENLCKQFSVSLSRFMPRTIKQLTTTPDIQLVSRNGQYPKRAVILAGGRGVRLAPVTEVIPKPLVPVGGVPILELVIRQLKAHGFQHITLAVGYMADLIRSYFGDGSRWGLKIDYSYEDQPLGTVGPLSLISGLQDTFLVMNADVLTDINYEELLKYHKTQGGLATIAAYEKTVKIDLGVIVKNGDGRIEDYVEKPTQSNLVSMGIYVFEPQVLNFINGGYLDFPDLVKLLLKKRLPVYYYLFKGYWLDIGRHDDYAQANAEFINSPESFQNGKNAA